MPKHMSATDARIHLGDVLDQVESEGIRVVVERAGKPVGVIVPIADLKVLERAAFDRQEAISIANRLRERVAEHRRGEPLPDVADEIREMREERDAEILGDLL